MSDERGDSPWDQGHLLWSSPHWWALMLTPLLFGMGILIDPEGRKFVKRRWGIK